MTNKKRNTKSPKRMRGKWKPLLCMALLAVLCASTLSYGTVFAGAADAERASEAAGISADAEAKSEGAEIFTDGEDDPAESSSPSGNVPGDEGEGYAPEEYYETEDTSEADEPAAEEDEGADNGTDAQLESADDETESGPDEEAEAEVYDEESDADPDEDEEPAGEGHRVEINQGEGGTLSFINAPESVPGESSDDDSSYYAIYLPGDTVRLKVVVDTKSPVLNANIYTADGERIDAEWTSDDEFWFVMPDDDVTISPAYYGITDDFLSFDQSVKELAEQLAFLPKAMSVSDQAYYLGGKMISYAGWATRYRTVDGNEAYCVQPSYRGPSTGWYDKHYDVENYIVVDNKSYGYEYVKSALWVSYGSPGFDASYWPSEWYDGTAMNSDRYYVLAHIVLADIYSANASAALYGTNDSFRNYVYTYVTGYNADGSESYNFANSTRGKIASALAANGNKSFADDGFTIFIIHTGSYQDILSFEYEETPDTYLTLQKVSSNTGISGNNDNYSLEGAVYYAYTDEACSEVAFDVEGSEAKFVTASDGSSNILLMDEGTYWVKETMASEGFSLDTSVHKVTVTSDNTEDNPAKVTSEESPKYGYIELNKRSGITGVTGGNGLYSLAGAEFGIYSDEGCTKLIETLTTNGSGYAMSGSLPLGTYYVKETVRPDGYSLDSDTVYKVMISSVPDAGSTVVEVSGSEGVIDAPLFDTLGIVIVKSDKETGESTPQGDADLSGAQFAVNFYAGDVPESVVSESAPTRSWVIETQPADDGTYGALLDESHLVSGDALYYDGAGSVVLPLGTYTIKEISAPSGYLLTGTFTDSEGIAVSAGDIYYTQILDDGSLTGEAVRLSGDNEYDQTDTVIRGGVKIQKRDLESGRTEAEGAATFEGAVFAISNESEWPVVVDGTACQPGETVMTLVTDENGYAETASDALPYGTYRITETQQPAGNLLGSVVLDAATDRVFEIRTDGEVVDLTGPDDSVTDQVKRADFSFEKQDGDNQSTDMGSIKFKITSETTGESHIFWTDMNGQYSSSSDWEPHSQHTNAGESFEDGLWFYGYADWDEAGLDYVDDGVGALPYDTYILEELPCEGNAGYTLITTRFTVYGDNTDLGARANVHLGTIDNYSYGFVTNALNSENGEKYLDADETAQITDEITYWGLTRGESYRFVAELYDVTADDMVRDGDGNAIASETVFTPWLTDGTHAVKISFDAAGLEGHTLVIFEYLYGEDDEIIEAEADAENGDQTVYFTEPEPEEPEEPETPETVDRTDTPSTPDTPSSSSAPASPTKTGDVGTTLWFIVVAAAASCLILGFIMRRRIGDS